jgi:hypothetical protein
VCPVSTDATSSNGECNGDGAGANKAVGNTIRRRGLVRAAGCMKHRSRGQPVAGGEGRGSRGKAVDGRARVSGHLLTCRFPGIGCFAADICRNRLCRAQGMSMSPIWVSQRAGCLLEGVTGLGKGRTAKHSRNENQGGRRWARYLHAHARDSAVLVQSGRSGQVGEVSPPRVNAGMRGREGEREWVQ